MGHHSDYSQPWLNFSRDGDDISLDLDIQLCYYFFDKILHCTSVLIICSARCSLLIFAYAYICLVQKM